MNIHPKVASGTAGAGLGGMLAIVFFWVMEGAFGASPDQFTPDRIAAVTGILSLAVAFLSGYMTSSPPPPQLPPPQPDAEGKVP